MPYKPNEREYRNLGSFDTQGTEESGELIVVGTPIVFDKPTVLFEYEGIEYKEQIARDALTGCDMSDFIFNHNHGRNDGTVYARNKNGSLAYQITEGGLDIRAYLDKEDERHKNLYRDIRKRLIDKMSFSFTVKEDSYDRDTHTRTILRFKKIFDVSAVDFPAYNDTSISTARDFFTAEYAKEFKALEESRRRRVLIAKTLC